MCAYLESGKDRRLNSLLSLDPAGDGSELAQFVVEDVACHVTASDESAADLVIYGHSLLLKVLARSAQFAERTEKWAHPQHVGPRGNGLLQGIDPDVE